MRVDQALHSRVETLQVGDPPLSRLGDNRRVVGRSPEITEGTSTDSGVGYGLQEALASFTEAADALRMLTTSLEQNSDMLIRGKKPPEK